MPDLGLDLNTILAPGRRPQPPEGVFARELVETDLHLLAANRGTKPPEIKRLRQRHHALARLLAAGVSEGEAAHTVGYDLSRVSILKGSPAFRELLSLYEARKDAEFVQTAAELSGLAHDAIVEIRDRLESDDDKDKISIGQLVEIARLATDRSGFGPSSKTEQTVNVNIAERIEAGRQRAKALAKPFLGEDAIIVNPEG